MRKKGLQFSFNIQSRPVFFDVWPLFTKSLHPTSLRPIPSLFGRATRRGMECFASSRPPKTYSPVEYMPLEDIERPERYHPGGYHPIVIGDCLSDRYDVVHKLGFGTYSTTWLARDRKTKKYVAIKIAVADADMQESKILGYLALSDQNDECLVTEPGMMSLAEAKDASYCRLFELPVAKAITAQVIQAVAFLHHRGIVHADLHTGNIMLRLPNSMDELSPEQLYEKYGRPNIEPIVRLDGKPLPDGVPTHGVVPIWLGKESELVTLTEAKIFLTDFGESFLPAMTQRRYSNAPDILVPPEIYFLPCETVSFPSDIWTLACFNPSKDWMIKEHVDTLGKLPHDWWQKWDARQRWFNEEGGRTSGRAGRSLTDRFVDSVQLPRQEQVIEDVGQAEKTAMLNMLRGMLIFMPGKRLTAAEVMKSEWILRWALPVLERTVTT
ncbi:CMGC/SRPK protein kinase [Blastomyces percursus]|uniref:CMGC/SRPK protein kinase n=1 Tax=Blastomyces percursus TaxID=1658174 RepID=A0A1J9Q558_9EURO|nr:CMGC/SRPK protein kinase [Blastomyces percursus]